MNERWKHQIKAGLPFGIIMPVLLTLFEGYGASYKDAFFSERFLMQLGIFLFVGVFVIGYSKWREVRKNEEYNKQK